MDGTKQLRLLSWEVKNPMKQSRAEELIEFLGLEPGFAGGYFGDVFRSPSLVHPDDDRPQRTALTTIYFLLVPGEPERWHRVRSDEVWHYYEGDPLELFWIDEEKGGLCQHLLGKVGEGQSPCAVVPAGRWQAARKRGAYTLVGCDVGPGFEYEDFELLSEVPGEEVEVRERFPELGELV